MKKHTMVIISVLLSVISLFMSLPNGNDAVKAGAGLGKNTDIETLDDMYSFLDYISNYDINTENAKSMKSSDTPTLMLMSTTSSDSHVDDTFNTKHTSATICESTFLESTVYQLDSQGRRKGASNIKLTRELTIYMTEHATYYVSKGTIENYDTENGYYYDTGNGYYDTKTPVYLDFDVQIYVENSTAMIKINKLVMSILEDHMRNHIQIKDEYIGKWIELPPEIAVEFFEDINNQNTNTLGELKSYLGNEIESNPDKNKSIYTIREDTNDTVTTIRLDMSDAEKPYTEFCIKGSTAYGKVNALDIITCCNIDNTVIKVKQHPDIVIKNEREFENIMNITEQEEN